MKIFSLLILTMLLSSSAFADDDPDLLCVGTFQAIANANPVDLEKILKNHPTCLAYTWKGYSLLTFSLSKNSLDAISVLLKFAVDPTQKDPGGREPFQFSVDQKFYNSTALLATLRPTARVVFNGNLVSLFDLSLLLKNEAIAQSVLNNIPDLGSIDTGSGIPAIKSIIDAHLIESLKVLGSRWPSELHISISGYTPLQYSYFAIRSLAAVNALEALGVNINESSDGNKVIVLAYKNQQLEWALVDPDLGPKIRTQLKIKSEDQALLEQVDKEFILSVVATPVLFQLFSEHQFALSYDHAKNNPDLAKDIKFACWPARYYYDEKLWNSFVYDFGWQAVIPDRCRGGGWSDHEAKFEKERWDPPHDDAVEAAYRKLVAADPASHRPQCQDLVPTPAYSRRGNQTASRGLLNHFNASEFDQGELQSCLGKYFQFDSPYPTKVRHRNLDDWRFFSPLLKQPGALDIQGLFLSSVKTCDHSVLDMLKELGFSEHVPVTMEHCEQNKTDWNTSDYDPGWDWERKDEAVFQALLKYNYYVDNIGQDYWSSLTAQDACKLILDLAKVSTTIKNYNIWVRKYIENHSAYHTLFERVLNGIYYSKAIFSRGECNITDFYTIEKVSQMDLDPEYFGGYPRDPNPSNVREEIEKAIKDRQGRGP